MNFFSEFFSNQNQSVRNLVPLCANVLLNKSISSFCVPQKAYDLKSVSLSGENLRIFLLKSVTYYTYTHRSKREYRKFCKKSHDIDESKCMSISVLKQITQIPAYILLLYVVLTGLGQGLRGGVVLLSLSSLWHCSS